MRFLRRSKPAVPVLTYHSLNVLENTYEANDHIAFESDLRTIDRLGFRVLPLGTILDWYEGKRSNAAVEGGVALTLDDGSWLDYHAITHPSCGEQASMFEILKTFRDEVSAERQPELHFSSFVIASPDARDELDKKNLIGLGWWGDDWWKAAQDSGLVSIECHSWDHCHELLDRVAQQDNIRGDFREIKTYRDCDAQVRQAGDYIEQTTGTRPLFFAYPWGQASRFMTRRYLPRNRAEHRFRAAFTIEPKHLTRRDNPWHLPRYVCGRDWKSPRELETLLLGQ